MLPIHGAVAAADPDAGVAAHYGDPMREQRLLEAGRGVVELPLAVVSVRGRDRLGWLDTLSSQRVRGLAPGESAELLLLDVHGRVEHAAALVDDGTTAWLTTEAGRADALAAFLDSMRFMLDVAVAREEDVAVLGTVVPGRGGASRVVAETRAALAGSDTSDAATASHAFGPDALRAVWVDPWPGVVPGGTRYALAQPHPGEATTFVLVLLAADAVDAVVTHLRAAGIAVAGVLAWEALRIAAWRPRLARDVDDKALPHELDWLRTAVHLDKGCYKGQEGVARTYNLGRPPRRLVLLHLDGSDHLVPEAGADVGWGGRVVGRVTSVARHHDLGPVALAVVKRTLDPDVDVEVAGPAGPVAASQEVIVPTDGYGEGRPQARGPVTPGLRR